MRITLAVAVLGLLCAIGAFFYGQRIGDGRATIRCEAAKLAERVRQDRANEAAREEGRRLALSTIENERATATTLDEVIHAPQVTPPAHCLNADRVRGLNRIR
jgi:phosphoribosylaminoimidazole carboxylase (NCAIR synthetase)